MPVLRVDSRTNSMFFENKDGQQTPLDEKDLRLIQESGNVAVTQAAYELMFVDGPKAASQRTRILAPFGDKELPRGMTQDTWEIKRAEILRQREEAIYFLRLNYLPSEGDEWTAKHLAPYRAYASLLMASLDPFYREKILKFFSDKLEANKPLYMGTFPLGLTFKIPVASDFTDVQRDIEEPKFLRFLEANNGVQRHLFQPIKAFYETATGKPITLETIEEMGGHLKGAIVSDGGHQILMHRLSNPHLETLGAIINIGTDKNYGRKQFKNQGENQTKISKDVMFVADCRIGEDEDVLKMKDFLNSLKYFFVKGGHGNKVGNSDGYQIQYSTLNALYGDLDVGKAAIGKNCQPYHKRVAQQEILKIVEVVSEQSKFLKDKYKLGVTTFPIAFSRGLLRLLLDAYAESVRPKDANIDAKSAPDTKRKQEVFREFLASIPRFVESKAGAWDGAQEDGKTSKFGFGCGKVKFHHVKPVRAASRMTGDYHSWTENSRTMCSAFLTRIEAEYDWILDNNDIQHSTWVSPRIRDKKKAEKRAQRNN